MGYRVGRLDGQVVANNAATCHLSAVFVTEPFPQHASMPMPWRPVAALSQLAEALEWG
jgi:hypothetical protein